MRPNILIYQKEIQATSHELKIWDCPQSWNATKLGKTQVHGCLNQTIPLPVDELFEWLFFSVTNLLVQLTPWLMEPGGSMPHLKGLSNNPYPEPNQPNYQHWYFSSRSSLILSSHLRLGLPKGLFPVDLPVKILNALLPSSILVTCPAYLNLLDLITLTILGEWCKLWISSL